jgi:hypothetical protein
VDPTARPCAGRRGGQNAGRLSLFLHPKTSCINAGVAPVAAAVARATARPPSALQRSALQTVFEPRPLQLAISSPGARRSPLPPGFIVPCLPTPAKQCKSGPAWVHEIKHDGYRSPAHQRPCPALHAPRLQLGRPLRTRRARRCCGLKTGRGEDVRLSGTACRAGGLVLTQAGIRRAQKDSSLTIMAAPIS